VRAILGALAASSLRLELFSTSTFFARIPPNFLCQYSSHPSLPVFLPTPATCLPLRARPHHGPWDGLTSLEQATATSSVINSKLFPSVCLSLSGVMIPAPLLSPSDSTLKIYSVSGCLSQGVCYLPVLLSDLTLYLFLLCLAQLVQLADHCRIDMLPCLEV
jgi:hypothetical protein